MLLLVVLLASADVLSKGAWRELQQLDDPDLQQLAKKLPVTVLASRADTTVRKYTRAFRRWKAWAVQHGLEAIPAKDCHLALYLQYLADCSGSKAAVEEACNAVAWFHSTAGLPSPTASPFVCATREGLQRSLAKPTVKKAPVTAEMLGAIARNAELSQSLADLRLATACLLAFAAFLRFDELINLRPCDCVVGQGSMSIRIDRSKTDQLRKGDEVMVARTGDLTCPVAMLEKYLQRTGMTLQDQAYLFRPITNSKRAGEALRRTGKISYTCLREQFKGKLHQLGFDPRVFGLHSLRAGGATAAANAGIPDRNFKRHGRWRSENAKDGYVEDSVESRLEVTRRLGL